MPRTPWTRGVITKIAADRSSVVIRACAGGRRARFGDAGTIERLGLDRGTRKRVRFTRRRGGRGSKMMMRRREVGEVEGDFERGVRKRGRLMGGEGGGG